MGTPHWSPAGRMGSACLGGGRSATEVKLLIASGPVSFTVKKLHKEMVRCMHNSVSGNRETHPTLFQ